MRTNNKKYSKVGLVVPASLLSPEGEYQYGHNDL